MAQPDQISRSRPSFVEPGDGGEELCSLAPPDVSALPVGRMVADLDASGDVTLVVGGCVDVSAAKIGVAPMTNTEIAIATSAPPGRLFALPGNARAETGGSTRTLAGQR